MNTTMVQVLMLTILHASMNYACYMLVAKPTGCGFLASPDERSGLILVQPVGEVLFEEWSLRSLPHTRHVGPPGVPLLLDEVHGVLEGCLLLFLGGALTEPGEYATSSSVNNEGILHTHYIIITSSK